MRREEVEVLVGYLIWVRERLLAAAGSLSDVEFRSREGTATRDLRGTLVHQLENEWAWRIRLTQGDFPAGGIDPQEFSRLADLKGRWEQEDRALLAWLANVSDRQLATRPPGADNVLPLWQYLVYVVTHGVQQFSEAAVLLTHLGHSPGEIGFLAFRTGFAGIREHD